VPSSPPTYEQELGADASSINNTQGMGHPLWVSPWLVRSRRGASVFHSLPYSLNVARVFSKYKKEGGKDEEAVGNSRSQEG